MRPYLLSATILICALVCVGSGVQAQDLKATTKKLTKSLLKSGVDSVLVYKPYSFYGTNMLSDSSHLQEICYIVSKQAGKLVIERLTSEHQYNKGQIITHNVVAKQDSLQLFDFLGKHFKSIYTDTLLPALVKYQLDGKDTLVRHIVTHANCPELVVVTKTGTYSNRFNDNDLYDGIIRNEDGSFREKFESVNYQHNISTSIYKIVSLLRQEVSEIRKTYSY